MRTCLFSMMVFALVVSAVRAEEPAKAPSAEEVMKQMAAAGQPGPEHKRLEPFVGTGETTTNMFMVPSAQPLEMQATVEWEWIMGGRFVQEKVRGTAEKPYEALGLMGYDRAKQKYTNVYLCGMAGMMFYAESTCDEAGKVFTSVSEQQCPLTGGPIQCRDEIVIESPNRIVVRSYHTTDGKESLAMEMIQTRK